MPELKPCPFCGCKSKIVQCDDEGNVRGEEYENNPWSGLGYRIVHESDDCPIYTCEDGYNLIYDSREQAENHWNTRAERTCENESSVSGIFTCSYCGADFYDTEISGDWNYCPNCGAEVV